MPIADEPSPASDQLSDHAPEAGRGDAREKEHPIWSKLTKVGLIVGIGGFILSALAFSLSLWDAESEREGASSVDSVEIITYPTGNAFIQFFMPLDTPFEDLPKSPNPNDPEVFDPCTSEQSDWLYAHGTFVPEYQHIEMRSKAASGAIITLKNFRAEGTQVPHDDPIVVVRCWNSMGSAAPSSPATLRLGIDEQARFDFEAENDSLVVYNLAPGETDQLNLRLQTTEIFRGSLRVTVVSGESARDIVLKNYDGTDIYAAAYPPLKIVQLDMADGQLHCSIQRGFTAIGDPCTIGQLKAELASWSLRR